MSQTGASAGVRLLRWVTFFVVLAAALFTLLLNWPWGSEEPLPDADPAPAQARPGQILYLVPDGASEGTHLAPQYREQVEGLESVERSEWRFRELLLWPSSTADDDWIESIAAVIPLQSWRWGAAPELSREMQLERDLLLGLRDEIDARDPRHRSFLYPNDRLIWLDGGPHAKGRALAWNLAEMRPELGATPKADRMTLADWTSSQSACRATWRMFRDDRLHAMGEVTFSNLGYTRMPDFLSRGDWGE